MKKKRTKMKKRGNKTKENKKELKINEKTPKMKKTMQFSELKTFSVEGHHFSTEYLHRNCFFTIALRV